MNEDERTARLVTELSGSGAQVIGPFQVWALDTQMSDVHLARIACWADLEFLMASGCPITDAGICAICCFHRLSSLDIGATQISADAIAAAEWPKSLTCFGLYELALNEAAVNRLRQLTYLKVLNCNNCGLSLHAFQRLAELPRLRGFEALGCPVPDAVAEATSRQRPNALLRLDSGVWQNGEIRLPRNYGA